MEPRIKNGAPPGYREFIISYLYSEPVHVLERLYEFVPVVSEEETQDERGGGGNEEETVLHAVRDQESVTAVLHSWDREG